MKILIIAILLLLTACSNIAKDKQMHTIGSAGIGAVAQAITHDVVKSSIVCIGVGVSKELYDEYSYGGFDTKDLLADAVGCAIGIAGVKVIQVYTDGDAVGVQFNSEF